MSELISSSELAYGICSEKRKQAEERVVELEALVRALGDIAKQTKLELELSSHESPSQRCRRTCCQQCNICDDPACGDNTSPLAQERNRLKHLLAVSLKKNAQNKTAHF